MQVGHVVRSGKTSIEDNSDVKISLHETSVLKEERQSFKLIKKLYQA